jgi:acetyltransferase-like isoleucine patch superfamily enzyme
LTQLSRLLKAAANGVALVLVSPCAFTSWLESTLHPGGEGVFAFWTHVLAILPGHPGMYLRRAFYRLTLTSGNLTLTIGFGAFFSHREVHVEDDVYVGPYAVIGRARLRTGSLIGTRANLLSGSMQHRMGQDGRWTASDASSFSETSIGPHCWIGEGATIMADVGDGSLVAAGAVVAAAVPAGVVVAGNPARYVRRVRPDPLPEPERKNNEREPTVLTGH